VVLVVVQFLVVAIKEMVLAVVAQVDSKLLSVVQH
jgi:hypothetical protein